MVDNIPILSKYPQQIIEPFQYIWKYELKGVGKTEYYSDAAIEFNEEKKYWTMSANTYIKSVYDQIEKLTKINLRNYGS